MATKSIEASLEDITEELKKIHGGGGEALPLWIIAFIYALKAFGVLKF